MRLQKPGLLVPPNLGIERSKVMQDKEFIGTCVENPFNTLDTLVNVVENYAIQITKATFLKYCIISKDLLKDMARFPDDYEFYKSYEHKNPKSKLIYFFTHSAVEYFYA